MFWIHYYMVLSEMGIEEWIMLKKEYIEKLKSVDTVEEYEKTFISKLHQMI